MALSICTECYEVSLASCPSTYTFETGLTAATDYVVRINDHFEAEYSDTITSDIDGNLTVDFSHFDRTFSYVSGKFTLKVFADDLSTDAEVLTIGTTNYTCIVFSMHQ